MSKAKRQADLETIVPRIKLLCEPHRLNDAEIFSALMGFEEETIDQALSAMQVNQVNQFDLFKKLLRYFAAFPSSGS